MQITAVDARTTIDRRYGEPVQLPAAIAELSLGPATTIPATLDTGCRDDLVAIDGQPLPVRVQAAVPVAAGRRSGDGHALRERPGSRWARGTHRITTAPGAESGLQVDRIVLAAAAPDRAGVGPARREPVPVPGPRGRTAPPR